VDLSKEANAIDFRRSQRVIPAGGPLAGALIAGALVAIAIGLSQSGGRETGPRESDPQTIQIAADTVYRWNLGTGEQALIFEGNCRVTADSGESRGQRVIVVHRRGADQTHHLALIIDDATRPRRHAVMTISTEPRFTAQWYRGRPDQIPTEVTQLSLELQPSGGGQRGSNDPGGFDDRNPIQQVQFEEIPAGPINSPIVPPPAGEQSFRTAPQQSPLVPLPGNQTVQPGMALPDTALPRAMPIDTPPATERGLGDGGLQFLIGGSQSIQFMPRGPSTPTRIQTYPLPESSETAVVARGGATVLIRDVQAVLGDGSAMDLGTISLSAETIVGWLPALSGLLGGQTTIDSAEGELYLEGDIVFRQGERVIYADRMYYNIGRQIGTILNAEAITPIPEYEGFVRLKADVMQQVSEGQFVGFGAAVTSSRMGVPRYWLQSEQVEFRDTAVNRIDPVTGVPFVDHVRSVSSRDNSVYIAGFPVLYWPVFSSNLETSSFYLTGLKIKNDSIFGSQVMADFDMFQLLGYDTPPPGVDWTLSTDYFSERGPALGTNVTYAVPGALGIPGPIVGLFDAWAINDEGLDNLGSDRRRLDPEQTLRGRALLRHRHFLPNDFELIAEVGLLSDRNFLEQYLENEWDQDKDHDTGLRLRKYYLNNLFDLHADVRVNEFYSETNRLPQLDHYNLGSGWFGDRLNWSAHNTVGYASLEVADAPSNPIEAAKFTTLPGELDREGAIASTRQELAAPLTAGIFKIVPFLSGEAGFYGEAADGDELTRLTGQAGIRGSLPARRIYPGAQSSLLNIQGLAHKIDLRGEIFYADSNTNLDELPLYDPLDDDAQEQFRRRFIFNTYGGPPLPIQYDPRTYAFRQGMQRYVTAPSAQIADDLVQGRVGIHQRLQTRRGLPGRERIVDLVRFDVETILFLNEQDANFGETIGPTRYDFRYNVGDRVTLLSDGYFDFFEDGLHSVSAGVMSSRPGLGDIYLGILSLEGPISSTVLRGQTDYRLNEKWIASAGATFDLGRIGNVGQQLALTRIGESMLIQAGITVDAGRDNVGFQFMVEPRFWPGRRLGSLGGQLIPPPGVEGLE
jgi:lipopolysaccharide export system protein LptA